MKVKNYPAAKHFLLRVETFNDDINALLSITRSPFQIIRNKVEFLRLGSNTLNVVCASACAS